MSGVLAKYYAKEVGKTALLCLLSFFALYVLIDYTSRAHTLHLPLRQYSLYYGLVFIRRSFILVPFSLLLATTRVVCQANSNNELIAARASGIALSSLFSSVIAVGAIAALLLYANFEFLYPHAMKAQEEIQALLSKKTAPKTQPQGFSPAEGQQIIFSHYNQEKKSLQDAYWIKSLDEVYHIESLYAFRSPPIAHNVIEITRNDLGQLKTATRYPTLQLPQLTIHQKLLQARLIPPMYRPISTLWKQRTYQRAHFADQRPQIVTALAQKLVLPLLCLIAVLLPLPSSTRFRRPLPILFICGGSLGGLVAMYMLLGAGYTLSYNGIVSPWFTMILPTGAVLGATLGNYLRAMRMS